MDSKMPIAIFTKYLGSTDKRGSRIKASVYRSKNNIWSLSVPYDHSADDAHTVGAQALIDKHWPGHRAIYVGASLDGGAVFSMDQI